MVLRVGPQAVALAVASTDIVRQVDFFNGSRFIGFPVGMGSSASHDVRSEASVFD